MGTCDVVATVVAVGVTFGVGVGVTFGVGVGVLAGALTVTSTLFESLAP